MRRKDLNSIKWNYAYLHSPDHNSQRMQENHSVTVGDQMVVESIFKDLDKVLIQKIDKADAVVGCVAWLTHDGILDALSRCQNGVSVILQKEDFLRPDYGASIDFRTKLRERYCKLTPISCDFMGYSFREKSEYSNLSIEYDWYDCSSKPIDISTRCVGYLKRNDELTVPRMHHKFLVFCKYTEFTENEINSYTPYAVWTGSFNMTVNGTKSLENAVYIQNEKLASSYYSEWFNILMISESLDWSNEWVEPNIHYLDECGIIS